MKRYGIELAQNTYIKNANIEQGDSFPVSDITTGQLFFRTDESKLYVRNADDSAWSEISESEIEISQVAHGFTSTHIGAPVAYNSSTWALGDVSGGGAAPTAVISKIVDADNFNVKQNGVIENVNLAVNEDGGALVANGYYFSSSTLAGKVTQVPPAKQFIRLVMYVALTADTVMVLNQASNPQYLSTLVDVDIPAPTDGQVLTYNVTTTYWEPVTPLVGAQNLIELNDVDIDASPAPTDGYVLTADGAGEWTAEAIPVQNVSVMTDNANGTYTHDDGTGTTVGIDTNADSNPFDPVVGGVSPALVSTNVQDALDELHDIVLNIDTTTVSVMTDNANGTYTHDDGTGTTVVLSTVASSNPYDPTVISPNWLVGTNVQAVVDELSEGVSNIVVTDNADGTYTFTQYDGTTTVNLDTNADSNPYDPASGGISPALIATNVQDAIDEVYNLALTNQATVSVVTDNADGTYTHDDGSGTTVDIDTNADSNPYDPAVISPNWLVGTDVQAVIDELSEGVSGTSVVDNSDGTYTYTAYDASTVDIDTNADTNPFNPASSGLSPALVSVNVQDAIDEVHNMILNVVGNTSIMTDNADGTYTHDDGTGTTVNIDTNADSNPFDPAVSGISPALVATDVQSALDELHDLIISGGGHDFATSDEVKDGTVSDNVISPLTGVNYLRINKDSLSANVPQNIDNTLGFLQNMSFAGGKTFTFGAAGSGAIMECPDGTIRGDAGSPEALLTIDNAVIDGGTF